MKIKLFSLLILMVIINSCDLFNPFCDSQDDPHTYCYITNKCKFPIELRYSNRVRSQIEPDSTICKYMKTKHYNENTQINLEEALEINKLSIKIWQLKKTDRGINQYVKVIKEYNPPLYKGEPNDINFYNINCWTMKFFNNGHTAPELIIKID